MPLGIIMGSCRGQRAEKTWERRMVMGRRPWLGWLMLVFCLVFSVECFMAGKLPELDHIEGLLYYFKTGDRSPTRKELLQYCQAYQYERYEDARNSGVGHQELVAQLREEWDRILKGYRPADAYVIHTYEKIERYGANYYLHLKSWQYFRFRDPSPCPSQVGRMKNVGLFFVNADNFQVLKLDRAKVQKYLDGQVDDLDGESLYFKIIYKLIPVSSRTYREFLQDRQDGPWNLYVILGEIQKIEVFLDNCCQKKIGQMGV